MKTLCACLVLLLLPLFAISCANESDKTENSSIHSDINSTAVTVSESKIDGRKELTLTVCRSTDNLVPINDGYFYAYDENYNIYKLNYDGDLSILSEGLEIYVEITDIKAFEYSEENLNNGTRLPNYEAKIEYLGLIARPYNQ